jgi:hypothetical protein
MNHTIAVVAHTSRAEQAHRLMQDTQASYLSMDDGTLGCEGNHRRVWEWLHAHSTTHWSIAMEDDALPVAGFLGQLTAALDTAPSPVVSLYLGRHHIPKLDIEIQKSQAVLRAEAADAEWITSRHLFHAVALAVRTDHLGSMGAHIATLPPRFPIDEAISHWANAEGIDVSYTWPSLVDHADLPTLFVHHDKLPRPPGRVAYRTGGRSSWSDRSITL